MCRHKRDVYVPEIAEYTASALQHGQLIRRTMAAMGWLPTRAVGRYCGRKEMREIGRDKEGKSKI
jgi:hypothetical protein